MPDIDIRFTLIPEDVKHSECNIFKYFILFYGTVVLMKHNK